jgi:serine/threonine protein kinase/tetratricopeptide (TPR) repeat protein
MTPERFRQIEQLAMLVLHQDESERAAFLEEACAGDRELRGEVESLLAADEKAAGFLAEPAAGLIAEQLTGGSGQAPNGADIAALPSTAAVGRYLVERVLGSGGMGLVYAAFDPELGRKVAIKLVRPLASGRMDASEGRARLLREAQALAQLTHPNVVAIHDVGTFGDQVFLAMEYVEGWTLTDWLSTERRGWREIVSMFAQAGKGLAAAHAKNIIHRDFKADNVWVGEDGRARVLDFGLARATRDAGERQQSRDVAAREDDHRSPRVSMLDATVTLPGAFLGTPPYMAPEQLRGELGDARTDQFSFCVALYLALYGELPFAGETVTSLLEEMEGRKIKEPPKSRRVPFWLRRVLLRGLSLNAADRYDSIDSLLEELTPRARAMRPYFFVPAALAIAVIALVLGRVERDRRNSAVNITSIAVLPLKNLSGDTQRDYFVNGMTEALITELGKIGSVQVMSYQSVVSYRHSAKPLPQIARELQVDAILEGGVAHSGEKVRITANLVQASPERNLWAESYQFNVRDVLAVQGEVARDVASRIRGKVAPPEEVRPTTARRVDSEAYEAYLLARAHLSKAPTRETWLRAKEYFEKAIEKDPGYAPAYAGLAELELRVTRGSLTRNDRDVRLRARQWAEKTLELDATLAEAHTTLARVAVQEWDWADAEREFQRAIELNPSYPLARIWYAMYLYAMLRFEEAVVEARRAQHLDPVSTFINTWAGAAYFFAGRVDEATASWKKALELDPAYSDASLVLARTYVSQGEYQQAVAELQRALSFNERRPILLGALAQAYARAGQREEALKLLAELKRIEAEDRGYVSPFGIIWAYAGLGDKEQAFAYLERCYQERRERLPWINVDPLMEPLRSDPRFDNLVRRIGLPTRGSSPHPR